MNPLMKSKSVLAWSRREFMAGAITLSAGSSLGVADNPPQAPTPPAPTPLAEAQIKAVLARHGKLLTKEQTAEIRRLIGEAQKTSEDLKTLPLTNADEPALIFHVYAAGAR
jgi:hypothetical protein